MPLYEYFCEHCKKEYEIFKRITEWTGKDPCPKCEKVGYRIFSGDFVHYGTKIEDAEYNVGLGCITKSKRHRDELAKRRGVFEIGNEDPEKIHNNFEKDRETKRRKSWENI